MKKILLILSSGFLVITTIFSILLQKNKNQVFVKRENPLNEVNERNGHALTSTVSVEEVQTEGLKNEALGSIETRHEFAGELMKDSLAEIQSNLVDNEQLTQKIDSISKELDEI